MSSTRSRIGGSRGLGGASPTQWFEAAPPVHLLAKERSLPKRLRPEETWEAWMPAADLAHVPDVERSS